MLQQSIALIIIAIFVWRLTVIRKTSQLSRNEFRFWLSFWIVSALAIIFLKDIDKLTSLLGFSSSGINFLLYLAIIILFYLIFRLRLQILKMDRDISRLVEKIANQEMRK